MKLHLFLCLFVACRLLHAQAVIITEIFADPTPSHGLPEREYLEIFNRSAGRISLNGYTLTYGTVRAVFPASFIESGEYALVCRNAHVQDFLSFGKVIGLSGLSLNNSGSTLKLSDPTGREVHYLSYSSSWYTPGRSEGYSLEMIDFNYPCQGRGNWQSTQATPGGTPGKPNSVARANPDTAPPLLLQRDLQENRVMLYFNEVLDSSFGENPGNFEVISGNAAVIQAAFLNNSREAVLLTLNHPPGQALELMIYGAADCSGNTGEDIRVLFEQLPDPLAGDIRLSEILFNPPPGGQDFVELYNTSGQSFNLKNWQFARLNAAGQITGHARIATVMTVLPPKSYLAFSPDTFFLRNHYPVSGNLAEIAALPAYNNDAGTVLLLKPDSSVFDRFTYSEKMHAALIQHPKGVSLERVSFQHDQWVSASSDSRFATPGAPNSRSESDLAGPSFAAEPLRFSPGSSVPVTGLTYKLAGGEIYAAVTLLDKHGRKVRTLGQNLLLGTSGRITWDGTDDRGSLLPAGYYVFVIHLFGAGPERRFYAKTVIE